MQKIAVVTGGSRGIGFGIASQLAEDGFHVVIMAVSPRENIRTPAPFRKLSIRLYGIPGSIASREDRPQMHFSGYPGIWKNRCSGK